VPDAAAISAPVGTGLKDDLINQLLWAAWQAGAFDLSDATIGTGVVVSTNALLPPVVMPGETGSQIEIGLGDIHITATLDPGVVAGTSEPVQAEMFLSASVNTQLDFDEATKRLVLVSPTVETWVQVTDAEGLSAPQGAGPPVAAAMETVVVEWLAGVARGGITCLPEACSRTTRRRQSPHLAPSPHHRNPRASGLPVEPGGRWPFPPGHPATYSQCCYRN
jgi:hypothetical protein